MSLSNQVSQIDFKFPFHSKAQAYWDKGWPGPLPIEERAKEKPPTGFTGHRAQEIDQDQINAWLKSPGHKKANIAMHMREFVIDEEVWELVCIDVDDYEDGGKKKEGYKQLLELEAEHGPLPPTWICSARTNGKSGCRFFRVKKERGENGEWHGLQFMGKAAPHIDICQSVHRYVLVYPSYHPGVRQPYQWYRPGDAPDGHPPTHYKSQGHPLADGGHSVSFTLDPSTVNEIPSPRDFAVLPEEWVDYLTRGRMAYTEDAIDMDSTVNEMTRWADEFLADGKRICPKTREKINYWKKAIDEDATSHDKITGAHWNILREASPLEKGHTGWKSAITEVNNFWMQDVGPKRNKRTQDEAREEIFRSKMNALRKIKAEIDTWDETHKGKIQPKICACSRMKKEGNAKGPEEYDRDDDGNAQHLIDLYPDSLLYVSAFQRWIFWDGSMWSFDRDGLARRKYGKVKRRQRKYVKKLYSRAIRAQANSGKVAECPEMKDYKAWMKHAASSGNKSPVENALAVAKAIKGVTVPPEIWDTDDEILGVGNGLLELKDPPVVRPTKKEDHVTHNTNVDYVPIPEQKEQAKYEKGLALWEDYLFTFFPDEELRSFVQRALGYCLLGGNPERLTFFLRGQSGSGKSTMLTAIKAALGDYADTVSSGIFAPKFENPELVQALPKRIVTLSEIDNHNKLDKSVFKRMCGGDVIACRELYTNEIVRRIPGFVVIVATNSNPTVAGADDALLRRLLVLPFETSVSKEEEISDMNDQIRQECGSAVLAWLVDGYRMFKIHGLAYETWPEEVKVKTKEFGSMLDEVGEFLADCTAPQEQATVPVQVLYDTYKRWCGKQGIPEIKRMSQNAFARQLTAKGMEKSRKSVNGNSSWKWLGIKLTVKKITKR